MNTANKKIYFFPLLFVSIIAFANPVGLQKAKQVGQSFLLTKPSPNRTKQPLKLNLVQPDSAVVDKVRSNNSTANGNLSDATPEFYVFNLDSAGFVIVAGDDRAIPILGYADAGNFDPDNIPPNAQKWLEGYKQEIRYAIENNIVATEEIQAEWEALASGIHQNAPASAQAVAPLIQTKWGQSSYYNQYCPYDNSEGEHTVTGCVATAMAQVMKFWNYPTTGTGFHSYNHSKYGTLNANFGSTTYNWVNMPNQLTSSSLSEQTTAVATLMYHCGVSVDMEYGVSGSSAYAISAKSPKKHCAEYALKTYFGYKSTLQGIQKDDYTQTQWINLLKTELDASRPVLYAGFGDGGHCFIADGYDNNDYFHFNWGWSSSYDGYFALDVLNPGSGGIGSGAGTYNNGQQAVIGIEPPEPPDGTNNFNLTMYADLSTSEPRYWFGDEISVTAEVENHGPDAFSGEFAVAVFDEQGYFVDFLSSQSVSNLQQNYYTTRTFTGAGGAPFIPGNYQVAVFYRVAEEDDWTIVPDDDGIILDEINRAEFEVYYSADIETNSAFTILENGKLVQNQTATVNVDVRNSNSHAFYGKLRVSLSNLDGSLAQNIWIKDENEGLSYNYHYVNGINFTGTITVAPGTYLMEVAYQKNGETSWYYAGSSDFQNPVYVIVEAPPIQADIYENNNTQAQAYNLPVSFSGNNASKTTSGSNLHIGTDIDYYKIALPAGYNYTVTPRLHDSFNSGNGQSYSADALFSCSLNNTNMWSETCDDVMTSSIVVENGGTLYFKVVPYFSGNTGTYLLDIKVHRTAMSGIEDIETNALISLYPNPAKDFVTIDLRNITEKISRIILCDMQGREIYCENIVNLAETIKLPLTAVSNGVYFVRIHSDTRSITEKIIVKK